MREAPDYEHNTHSAELECTRDICRLGGSAGTSPPPLPAFRSSNPFRANLRKGDKPAKCQNELRGRTNGYRQKAGGSGTGTGDLRSPAGALPSETRWYPSGRLLEPNGTSVENRDMNGDRLLEIVTEAYLGSRDFNGFSFSGAAPTLPNLNSLTETVSRLVEVQRLELLFDGADENPAVKRFRVAPRAEQVQQLRERGLRAAWAYPSPSHLALAVNRMQYAGTPFTLRMALGEPQLTFQAFNPTVLERYRNDPRFKYKCDETQGSLRLSDGYRERMQSSDDSFLETFGFAYDDSGSRAVAVYLRYLRGLTPEYQQIWNLHALNGTYRLHPDYWKITVGSWDLDRNIFSAILDELRTINAFSGQMGRPPLFRNESGERPKEFAFLIRPTSREYRAFVLTLDQMLSDNISVDFFKGEVEATERIQRKDGAAVVQQKGTIKMLEEWLLGRFRAKEPDLVAAIFDGFRRVRKERQKPAHVLEADVFDEAYYQQQRDLLSAAHYALRLLRTAFQNHPDVRPKEVACLPRDDHRIWLQ
jgi:hypothetical protein